MTQLCRWRRSSWLETLKWTLKFLRRLRRSNSGLFQRIVSRTRQLSKLNKPTRLWLSIDLGRLMTQWFWLTFRSQSCVQRFPRCSVTWSGSCCTDWVRMECPWIHSWRVWKKRSPPWLFLKTLMATNLEAWITKHGFPKLNSTETEKTFSLHSKTESKWLSTCPLATTSCSNTLIASASAWEAAKEEKADSVYTLAMTSSEGLHLRQSASIMTSWAESKTSCV